jgi:hypothetical protein
VCGVERPALQLAIHPPGLAFGERDDGSSEDPVRRGCTAQSSLEYRIARSREVRDEISVGKFNFGVFTQPDPKQTKGARRLALQLPFVRFSESMGNHDSNIVDADSVD